jgi:hypothetical protein
MQRLRRGTGAALLFGLVVLLLAACSNSHGPEGMGGESHFLRRCEDQCGSGLDCIQGVCTRGCVVGKNSCDDLADQALCTADSVEPGQVAVCDLACASDHECRALSSEHHCEAGFCRAPAASISGSDRQDSDPGAEFPYPTDKVFPCPDNVVSDPIEVKRAIIQDDTLLLRVSYSAGCKEHSFAVCFTPFTGSLPPMTSLRVIHENRGETCEAYATTDLRFDLTPIGEAGMRLGMSSELVLTAIGFGPDSDPSTSLGAYTWDSLSCDDRALGARVQVASFERQASRECQTAEDCVWFDASTACIGDCYLIATNRGGAAELQEWVTTTNATFCSNYGADGCSAAPGLLCVPQELACYGGECAPRR